MSGTTTAADRASTTTPSRPASPSIGAIDHGPQHVRPDPRGVGPGTTTGTGWWGENPPYHHPVFVLTHHARAPIEMEGGTTFHFVTDGIESALEQAFAAAGGEDVRLGGGVATVQQYLRAGWSTSCTSRIAPVLLGER